MPRLLDPESAAAERARLVKVARGLCGSSQLAEDLTQETYARVLAKPRALSAGAEFPYLVRTLRNVANDHWRAERRRPPLVAELPGPRADPEPAAVAAELYRARLQLALAAAA